ncbi:MAG: hypothetical protein KDD14_04710 [Saprospiraceae bacterium]|nr:hypothetical protein [Saprospiraceae bacterium]
MKIIALLLAFSAVVSNPVRRDPMPLELRNHTLPSSGTPEVLTARGTGRTTGHIATMLVKNTGDQRVVLLPAMYFIPSDGNFQNYLGRIVTPVSIAPGATAQIQVIGYCTDIHRPPVPSETAMVPFEHWIRVREPGNGAGTDGVFLEPETVVAPFEPGQIPAITRAPGFTTGPDDPLAEFIPVWPGTNQPTGGTLAPGQNPAVFASVVAGVVVRVEQATAQIISTGNYPTPFSGNPEKERESITQQTVWITMGALTGQFYQKADFTQNVYKQFKDNTGVEVASLPEESKKNVDNGVDAFWAAFSATGVEAKVLKMPGEPSNDILYDIEEEPGIVFEDSACTWRRICIEVFVMARRDDNTYVIRPVYVPYDGYNYRSSEIRIPADAFDLADGALADLTNRADVAALLSNLQNLLSNLNQIYAPCCIWFDLNKVYAVDPSHARVKTENLNLDGWVNMQPDNADGQPVMDAGKEIDGLSFLGAAQRFVTQRAGLPASQCLKMFIGPGFKGGDESAGKGQPNGFFSAFDQSRLSPRDPGFVPAHEIGHNLMGSEHWHADNPAHPDGINPMEKREPSGAGNSQARTRDIRMDAETQCPKAQARAAEIGTPQNPPPPPPPARPEGNAQPSQPEQNRPQNPPAEPQRPVQPQPAPPPEREPEPDKPCPCPEPTAAVANLESLRNLQEGQKATAQAELKTCCAVLELTVELERLRDGEYNVVWNLDLRKTNPECFVSFELDRYYNSKKFEFVARGGGSVKAPVQVNSVDFQETAPGHFRLRTDAGFERNYQTTRPRGMTDQWLKPGADNRLNHLKEVVEWQLVLGGAIKCKDGDQVRSFPFHLIFQKTDTGEMELRSVPAALTESDVRADKAKGDLVRKPIFRMGG